MTGRGRGAVAVVRVSGVSINQVLRRCWRGTLPVGDRVRYGLWVGPSGRKPGESVVVSRSTDGSLEICCHGGVAAVDQIARDLIDAGATEADHRSGDLLIDEADDVLRHCQTSVTAAIAMTQSRGALRRWADQSLQGKRKQLQGNDKQAGEIAGRWQWSRFLSRPARVVLCGPPNVGKSSLINRLIGHRRVLTDAVAGTTRDAIDCDTVLSGWPVRLTDTAGLHLTDQAIEQEGIERAMQKLRAADLILRVTDPAARGDAIAESARSIATGKPSLRVVNKVDPDRYTGPDIATRANPLADDSGPPDWSLADDRTDGITALADAIAATLFPAGPWSEVPVAVNERQAGLISQIAQVESRDQRAALLRKLLGQP